VTTPRDGARVNRLRRRDFLATLAAGLVVPFELSLQPASTARKHWAWMRGEIKNLDQWRRLLASLKRTGFDAVLISGNAGFYRKYVPVAKEEGLELHAWMFTMMRGENVKAHPEWYAVNRRGESTAAKPPYVDYYKFMCPSRDEVRAYLREVVGDIASVEGLGSVHLDYIRYPDVILPVALWPKYKLVQDREHPEFDYCYCDVCRDTFRRLSGVDPLTLPDPPAHQAWLQYRYDTITSVVAELFDVAHRHGKPLTAAVFPTPSIARSLVRQDWTKWKVDAVLPMVYNGFYKEDVAWIERATREGVRALGGRIPLYCGLYVPDLSPAGLAEAASLAFEGGARGISVFEGNMLTTEYLKALSPVLKTSR
jgi:uncharacterized lipoprotein YddW (UPF0748 family)